MNDQYFLTIIIHDRGKCPIFLIDPELVNGKFPRLSELKIGSTTVSGQKSVLRLAVLIDQSSFFEIPKYFGKFADLLEHELYVYELRIWRPSGFFGTLLKGFLKFVLNPEPLV
ncbi:MAG: hypothetical protein QG650_73 [Patescibacteria group bacterium]|nr:hypothetical protein [Patescibacteria group bacterium]